MIIKKYESENSVKEKQELLKAKQVLERYPIITNYGLNEAVKRGDIPVVKIGRLNFYDSKDIEKYINKNKIKNNYV